MILPKSCVFAVLLLDRFGLFAHFLLQGAKLPGKGVDQLQMRDEPMNILMTLPSPHRAITLLLLSHQSDKGMERTERLCHHNISSRHHRPQTHQHWPQTSCRFHRPEAPRDELWGSSLVFLPGAGDTLHVNPPLLLSDISAETRIVKCNRPSLTATKWPGLDGDTSLYVQADGRHRDKRRWGASQSKANHHSGIALGASCKKGEADISFCHFILLAEPWLNH